MNLRKLSIFPRTISNRSAALIVLPLLFYWFFPFFILFNPAHPQIKLLLPLHHFGVLTESRPHHHSQRSWLSARGVRRAGSWIGNVWTMRENAECVGGGGKTKEISMNINIGWKVLITNRIICKKQKKTSNNKHVRATNAKTRKKPDDKNKKQTSPSQPLKSPTTAVKLENLWNNEAQNWLHTRVENNKTNKAQASCFGSTE